MFNNWRNCPTIFYSSCRNLNSKKHCPRFQFLQHIRVLLRVMHPMGLDKCIMTCIHHYSIMQNSFTALKILCAPPIHPHLFPSPDNYLSFYCLHSFAFSRMSCSWNCTVCSLFFKFLFYLFFGCVGSSLLHTGFL